MRCKRETYKLNSPKTGGLRILTGPSFIRATTRPSGVPRGREATCRQRHHAKPRVYGGGREDEQPCARLLCKGSTSKALCWYLSLDIDKVWRTRDVLGPISTTELFNFEHRT
jgi:hypothetical protein